GVPGIACPANRGIRATARVAEDCRGRRCRRARTDASGSPPFLSFRCGDRPVADRHALLGGVSRRAGRARPAVCPAPLLRAPFRATPFLRAALALDEARLELAEQREQL